MELAVMFIRCINFLILTTFILCVKNERADLSFDSIPTTKHPSPSSYTVEQLAKEIQMPTVSENHQHDPVKENPLKRQAIDVIADGFRKFIQHTLVFFRKAGDAIISFFKREDIKNIYHQISISLTPTSVSLPTAEKLGEDEHIEEPLRDFNDVKATHFEDTELPFAEKERLREEIERCKRTKQAEESFAETTDETE